MQRVAQCATKAAHEMRHQGERDAIRARAHRRLQQQVAATRVTNVTAPQLPAQHEMLACSVRCHKVKGAKKGIRWLQRFSHWGNTIPSPVQRRRCIPRTTFLAFLGDLYVITVPSCAPASLDVVTSTVKEGCGIASNLGKMGPSTARRHQGLPSLAQRYGGATSRHRSEA